MTTEIKSLYQPRRHFLPFHQRPNRWGVLVCHRRAGKTVALVNELLERGMLTKKPHARFSYVAPFYSQAKAVAFDYLMRYSEPYRKKHNVAELQVELINGTRVKLYGGDNPDALRGLYHDGVGVDEPAQLKPRLWREVIRPSLADREGWAVFTGTPAGKNEFYDIWEKAENNPSWYRMMLKASESGILPKEELDEARESMDEDDYAQEFECSFEAAIRGSYYGKSINQMGERLTTVPYDPTLPVHVAFDIGWRDDTTLWFWQSIGQREHHVIDAYSSSGLEVADYCIHMRSKPYHYGSIWLPHDAFAKTMQTGKSTFEEFVNCGVRAQRVPEISVQQGINAARGMIRSPSVYIDEVNCADGLEALRQYQREWDEKKQTFRENPRHDWASHYADSFRYMAVVINISAGESQNRIRTRPEHEVYDPTKPYGGNVKLNDLWAAQSAHRGRGNRI